MSRPENEDVAAEKTKGISFKERIVDIYVSAGSLFVYDKRSMEKESKGAAADNEYAGMRLQHNALYNMWHDYTIEYSMFTLHIC